MAIWSLDRLGRGFSCFDLFRELSRLGVRILSVREPWTDIDGPARELLAAVMAWVSGFERQRLIERVHAGLDRARRQEKALGRPRTSIVLLRASAPPRAPSRTRGKPNGDRTQGRSLVANRLG